MADELTNIYLDELVYYKPEIDDKLTLEATRVDTAIDLKLDKNEKGSPSGVGTLNANGQTTTNEIPFASIVEAVDPTNNDKIMTPERTHYIINIGTVKKDVVGVPEGVAPLDISGKIDPTYLHPTRTTNIYVVGTLQEMYDLVVNGNKVLTGDRCIVTTEPLVDDNGEYVAITDNPSDATGWKLLPNLSAVQSVNGMTGDVTISSISESAQNKTDVAALDVRVVQNTNNATLLEGRVATTETDIATNVNAIATNASDIGTTSIAVVALEEKLKIDDTNIGVDLNTLLEPGQRYYVSGGANIPTGESQGVVLAIGYENQNPIRQEFTNQTTGDRYFRTSGDGTGLDFGVWTKQERTLRFWVSKADGINVATTLPDYSVVNNLNIGVQPPGMYKIDMSMIFTYETTGKSADIRARVTKDGLIGSWVVIRREPKDSTDQLAEGFPTVIETLTEDEIIVEIEATRESGSDPMNVLFSNIIVERKV